MNTRILMAALLLTGAIRMWGAETLDRVVATVNGHALLQSDLNDEVAYECFMSGRAVADFTGTDRKGAFNRLVDQELLREQMHSTDFKPVAPEEIDKQIGTLKSDYVRQHSGETWELSLRNYGISEATIRERVELELNQLRLVENRLRPTIQIEPAAVEQYYREQIMPKLSGAQISLGEAAPKIREILIEQRLNELLDTWLESLRSQAQVRVVSPELSATESTGQ